MYDRQKAVKYAIENYNKRNPLFYDFENLGGDCTNFISQCLYYGGHYMNANWFFKSLNNRSPSWTGVNEFYNYVIKNYDIGAPKGKIISPYEVNLGDIVQLRQFGSSFNHTLIITKIDSGFYNFKDNVLSHIFVSCHTKDELNKRLSNYKILEARFIKIIS